MSRVSAAGLCLVVLVAGVLKDPLRILFRGERLYGSVRSRQRVLGAIVGEHS
jgi:hypothetical protein